MTLTILGKRNYLCPVALTSLKNIAHVALHDSLHWALARSWEHVAIFTILDSPRAVGCITQSS